MTKVEIIRELTRSNPKFIKSLDVIYHNRRANVKYVYTYEFISHLSLDARRELAMVLLSLYKLRKYVECIRVVYFPFDDDNEECITKYASDIYYSSSISDFVKYIKPIKK